MSGTRSTQVPFEHVVAELVAAPLAAADTLGLAVTELDPKLKDETGLLWRATEKTMLASFSAYSVDELTALRDWLWFGEVTEHEVKEETVVPLGAFLRRFAQNALIFAGNAFRPKLPQWSESWKQESGMTDDPLARRYWRWISFALPQDLMIAAHGRDGDVAAMVELISPVVRQILLDEGYVEPHMHLGAAYEFQLLWVSLQHALVDLEKVRWDSFQSPGAVLDDGRKLGYWLVLAGIARYVLAGFLQYKRDGWRDRKVGGAAAPSAFHDFVRDEVEQIFKHVERVRNPDFRADHGETGGEAGGETMTVLSTDDPQTIYLLRQCLDELATGQIDLSDQLGLRNEEDALANRFASFQRVYEKLARIAHRWPAFPETLTEAIQADPIGSFFPTTGVKGRSSEIEFVAAGLEYLETDQGAKDLRFARIFWQVIRIRCLFYRHVVQRPLTPGLQWFIRFYGRLVAPRRPIPMGLMTESAAVLCGKDLGLKSLEVRMSPASDEASLKGQMDEVIKKFCEIRDLDGEDAPEPGESGRLGARPRLLDNDSNVNQSCEYGVVLHFAKARQGGARRGVPTANAIGGNVDPSKLENIGYRHGAFYREKRKEAMAIAAMIRRFPRVLYYLRGVDICSDELGTPNWVLAPFIRYVKEVSRKASGHLLLADQASVQPLRTTAHAGEEFIHLLGGLRRVDETVEYLHMSQGDRLGHALALGVNPVLWASQTRGVAMSRMERLMDLAWEWKFTTQHSIEIPASRIQMVLDEIIRLSRQIFGVFCQPTKVVEFMDLLHDEQQLKFVGFPNGPIPDFRTYVEQRVQERYARSGRIPLATASQKGGGEGNPADLGSLGNEPWILLYRYLVEQETFRQGQERILIDPAKEAETLDVLQRELRRKIGNLGICVEINPSSNLLIGNMADLENHPLWRLNPPYKDDTLPPISVCVGSDDPINFCTSTREEYQLVYDTLTLAGLSDFEARGWIDDARRVGLGSRFTFEHSLPRDRVWDTARNFVDDTEPPP